MHKVISFLLIGSFAIVTGVFADNTWITVSSPLGTNTVISVPVVSWTGLVWNDRDSHGCIWSAGYIWNAGLNQCTRPWEEINAWSGITQTWIISNSWAIKDLKTKINENISQIQDNWAKFHEDNGFIKQFLKKPATKEEVKTLTITLKAEVKNYHDAVKALIKEGQDAIKANTFDPAAFNVKVEAVFTTQFDILSKYVDATKMDAFKKFMDEKKAVIIANKDMRSENFQIKTEIKVIKKKALTDTQRAMVDKKLTDRTEVFLSRLIGKIDELTWKTKNDKLKDQLNELKDIAQGKLDAISK